MVWFRSILFQLYFFATVVLTGTSVLLVWPFGSAASYAVTRLWAKGMMAAGRILLGLDYVVDGEEHIPDTPCIAMIKHSSVFEAYAQVALLPRQAWVLKRELFWIPFFGWGLITLKPIAINRSAGGSAVKQVVRQGKERLAEGIWVTVFPEGTRVLPGATQKYGVSGALLAQESGVPVVPVAHNAGDFWPRRSLRKEPGLIRISIGPPIETKGLEAREINRRVQSWIEGRMAEISDAYKDASAAEPATERVSSP